MIVTSTTFDEEVLKFEGVTLVDFWATWCGPCQMQAPILQELETELKDSKGFKICKLDTDENSDIAQKYNIMSIPNLKFFKGGQVVGELVGLQTKQKIKEKFEELSK
ncbi:MAG: thioredoxin [bacterium]